MSFSSLLNTTCDIQRFTNRSIVIGTDDTDYYCTAAHTSASTNKPITGADYADYWSANGTKGEGSAWVTATSYVKAIDNYGEPVVAWATVIESEPCRLMKKAGYETIDGKLVVVANYMLFVKFQTITEKDRVVIGSDTYEVRLVYNASGSDHHLELGLEIIE